MLKKRQHYVWRHYLKQWTINEKIFCHREGVIFGSGLMGVGQSRYFYKLNELSKQDIHIIYKVAIEPTYNHLQKINKNWVSLFNYIFEIKNLYEKSNINNPDIDKLIHETIHNFEEEIHANIENGAISHLDSILNKNISFYNNKKNNIARINFSQYIAVQMFRTERTKQAVKNSYQKNKVNEPVDFDIERIWNVITHIFATNMSWSLYEKPFKIVLLENLSDKEFITGDQPVINTFMTKTLLEKSEPPPDTELYYPISPKLAILITKDIKYLSQDSEHLSEDEVIKYNKMIISNSHNQVYATSKEILEENNLFSLK